MKNFVTYSSAEFKCGPSLNMIIGPNGTGKSSLVCAICLGLGWAPHYLGRAKEIGEFVKNGCREAEIEIELKALEIHRGRNQIVKRIIRREGNKSTWHINGSSSTLKDVQKLTRQFHIQVDNLCQFLPQDKVVEFAAMTPVQLLEQTQRAAGTDQMLEWHESLKSLGTQKKKLAVERESCAQTLQDHQKRQNQQKADVDRMQERVHLVRRQDALEKFRPFVQCQDAKRDWEAAKEKKAEAEALLAQLELEVQPSLEDVEKKIAYQEQINTVLGQRKKMYDSSRRKADRTTKEASDFQDSINNCDDQINSKRKAKIERKKIIAAIQSKITHLEAKLKSPPPEFSEQELNEKRRALVSERRECETHISEIDQLQRADVAKFKSIQSRHLRVSRDLEELSTKTGQQKQKLQARSKDTYRAWEWIQEHKDLFEGEVFGPPMISCSVRQPKYADAIETAMQYNDFLAFTVTKQADFRTLNTELYNKLGLQDITIRTSSRSLNHWQRPANNATLEQFGFDGWLIDGLEGPEAVLSMLCGSAKLHSCAFTTNSLSDEQLRQLEKSPIQHWCTKDDICSIQRRREYGPQAVSTMVRRLVPAKCWTDQGIDSSRQAELVTEKAGMGEEMEQLKQALAGRRDDSSQLKEKKAGLAQEIVCFSYLLAGSN
jgi:structural maintenance of chromosomes protein 5